MESSLLIRPALSHQAVEVRMKVDPVPEGLDGRDDPVSMTQRWAVLLRPDIGLKNLAYFSSSE